MDASAGYSGTPQATKLGLKPGVTWDVVGAPDDWAFEVEPDLELRGGGDADVVLAFVSSADQVRRTVEQQERRIFPAGALWIAWPRKAAGHLSDVDENLVRDTALLRGLVDVKVAALDTDWSALKIVWRKENRG
ncbi:DUF3052 domain-containing protein [Pseudolysinimonas sp.]|uniref:DUF3052 domain-containing protein n=1 Tax=Pseudolysinimonas sp. TaxID=2680009 RepID=UPI00286A9EAB|nr:DUF3052 domain-containing protein [Pseudolysinimonas sp.]